MHIGRWKPRLWKEMVSESALYLGTLSQDEREVMAAQFTGFAFAQVGLLGRVTAQMGPFDLLWALLALSTAWGMMKKEEEELAPVAVGDPPPRCIRVARSPRPLHCGP